MAKKHSQTFNPGTGAGNVLSNQGGEKSISLVAKLLDVLERTRERNVIPPAGIHREAGKKPRRRSDRSGERKP